MRRGARLTFSAQQAYEMALAGYTFAVLPDSFIVGMLPDLLFINSKDVPHFGWRKKHKTHEMHQLFQQFRKEVHRKYNMTYPHEDTDILSWYKWSKSV